MFSSPASKSTTPPSGKPFRPVYPKCACRHKQIKPQSSKPIPPHSPAAGMVSTAMTTPCSWATGASFFKMSTARAKTASGSSVLRGRRRSPEASPLPPAPWPISGRWCKRGQPANEPPRCRPPPGTGRGPIWRKGHHLKAPGLDLLPEGGTVLPPLIVEEVMGRSGPKLDALDAQLPLSIQKILKRLHPVVDVHGGKPVPANLCYIYPPFHSKALLTSPIQYLQACLRIVSKDREPHTLFKAFKLKICLRGILSQPPAPAGGDNGPCGLSGADAHRGILYNDAFLRPGP